jgi:hypothetical protein
MPAVTAGDQVRAPTIREQLPLLGWSATDVTVSQSIDTTSIPGLAVVVEPRTDYAIDGYIAYDTGTTPKIAITTLALEGATGHWSTYCLGHTGTTTGVGAVDARVARGYGSAINLGLDQQFGFNAAGGDGIRHCCLVSGFLATASVGGALQFGFFPMVADAAVTTVAAGSWIELTRLGSN